MIEALRTNDADAVVKNVLCFRKRSFGRCTGFLHDKAIINSMNNPKKFAGKFKKKLDDYIKHRMRNLSDDKKKVIVDAITKAYSAFVQKHIAEAQATLPNQSKQIAATAQFSSN